MNTFNYKKSVQALNYLAVLEGGAINYMKALKLIWLSDRYHLRNHGRTITGDKYFALKNGPVASFTKDIIINKHITEEQSEYSSTFVSVNGYDLSTNSEPNTNVFSQKELEVINTVYDNYKGMDEFEISEFSHNFPEWKQYEEKIKKTGSSYVIDMNLFFENYKDKTNLFVNNNEELEEMKSYQKTFFPSFAVV
jgi:uncharacterized phage-associated protein